MPSRTPRPSPGSLFGLVIGLVRGVGATKIADVLGDIRAIFFDWGQTLVSVHREKLAFIEGAEHVARDVFAVASLAPDSATQDLLDLLDRAIEQTAEPPDYSEVDSSRIAIAWLRKLKVPRPEPGFVGQLIDRFWACWIGCLDALPDVDRTLGELKRRGYRLLLVSNVSAPPDYCRQQLEHLGLAPYFEATVFSSAVGHRKPHATIYQAALAAARTGEALTPEQILFVGDSPINDVTTPMGLGMHAALIKNDQTHWPDDAYEQARPDLTIPTVTGLLDRLPGGR